MAKNATAAPHIRSAKPKTAEQIRKAQENDRIAKERLEFIQNRQKMANELRKKGFVGRTDMEVIHNFNKHQTEEMAREWVNQVLAVPSAGESIRRWLKDRINQSAFNVKMLIVKFLERDGSNGTKDNSNLAATVYGYLQTEQGQRILRHKIAA